MSQFSSGGFRMWGTWFRVGMNQSPEVSISRAISAKRPSLESVRGRTACPARNTAAQTGRSQA